LIVAALPICSPKPLKPVPAGERTVTVIADAKAGKEKVEFEKKGDALVSKGKLPEGDGYSYRMIYPKASLLRMIVEQATGRPDVRQAGDNHARAHALFGRRRRVLVHHRAARTEIRVQHEGRKARGRDMHVHGQVPSGL
jgi:hypothetical protein